MAPLVWLSGTKHQAHTKFLREIFYFYYFDFDFFPPPFIYFSFLQVLASPTPLAPTHHPTVIVPAPTLTQHPHHHVTVVTMSPSAHTSTVSTSRQNLDTIVQVRVCFSLHGGSLLSRLTDFISQWKYLLIVCQGTSFWLQPSVFLLPLLSGHPAHRTHSGEESERWGGAEASGHREPYSHRHGHRLLRHRHGHRGRRLLDELIHPLNTLTHTHTHM